MGYKKFVVIREVGPNECNWLANKLKPGIVVYEFPDVYKCSTGGYTVSLKEGEYPYFEIPVDAVREIKKIDFSLN